ncbi:hypothetical protein [Arthrobacter glacialis]|uniref:Uncharacterized protein n=1 Tax=Arthrobacter glacialis TaxID=1664 RepID=A0A2S3ZZ99_ARTGL|nr:hypothetical protein [Arthrobacter glacialis]POH74571.1 hypothetical protein CVS27_04955 [Arthrobacter glacialis]
MTVILQWTALAVCLACTIWRSPSLFGGRNRGLSWAFALATVSVALSLPAIYLPVDALLGGINLANVLLRLSIFGVFFLLTSRVAAAYNSPLARALIRGPLGVAVLAVCSLGICVAYFLADVDGSSTGLVAFTSQPEIAAYMWFGVAYTTYASACVVVATAKAAFSRRPAIDRTAAFSMLVGFALVCATVPLRLPLWKNWPAVDIMTFAAILFVAVGLVLVWISFGRRRVRGGPRA